jgi:hypothetical protein
MEIYDVYNNQVSSAHPYAEIDGYRLSIFLQALCITLHTLALSVTTAEIFVLPISSITAQIMYVFIYFSL